MRSLPASRSDRKGRDDTGSPEPLMAAKLGLVLDCADPDRLAEFWSAAIGYTTLGGAGSYVLLVDEVGQQPKLLLQRVTEAKAGKNRMHFDIETSTVDDEVARLEAIGARRIVADAVEEHGNRWVVMADPEGNEFCVCNAGQPG
jgi:predicted enzyme related to lactoylglutathione lyase